jgi:hypothetical protein
MRLVLPVQCSANIKVAMADGRQAGIAAAASGRAHSRWRSGRWYLSSPGYVTFSDEEDLCIDTANDFLLRANLPESLDGLALYF